MDKSPSKKHWYIYLLLFTCNIFTAQSQISYADAFPGVSFNLPVEIQNAADGTDRLFVVEQAGAIKVFPNNANVTPNQVSTFLDLSSRIAFSSGQEVGLLGLAFHPNFKDNGYLYVYFTDRPGFYRINVARFQVDPSNPNYVNPNTETLLYSFVKNTGNSNHNGGKIGFGPDGYLYISVGDGGGSNDPNNNAQNLDNPYGSILRIDVDTTADGKNYGIPPDNPRVNQSGLDEIYAWGIRNTWKFSFDGDILWGADVGQNLRDEINLIEKGKNYGWRKIEGNVNGNLFASTTLVTTPDTKPIFDYNYDNGDRSVTGGYVYHGSLTNQILQDKYIFGDYISGRVWSLTYNANEGTATRTELFKANGIFISSFGLDEAGEIYFSDYGNNVKIYKIIDEAPEPTTTAVDGVGVWMNQGVPGCNGEVEITKNIGNNEFYIGGEFTNVSGIAANNLAKYTKDEGYSAIGSGTNGRVNAIEVASNGHIYVGGSFTEIDGVPAANIAVWDGTTWSGLGEGTSGPIAKIGIDANDNLYVGGSFQDAGNVRVNNIALWNGAWNALTDTNNGITGTNNEIRAITLDENNVLYVGGNFDSAGGNSAPRIATWNGTNWGTLGTGTSGFVQAILVLPNYIYAGGNFSIAGGNTVNRIARWNRNTNAWESLDYGLSGNVNTLAHNDTHLYVGGTFETASDQEGDNKIMKNIARWSDADGWEALGTNKNVGVGTAINSICFTNNNTELYVGGNFSKAGVINANNVAFWRNTTGCNDNSITPQYTINGQVNTATSSLEVTVGDNLVLGIQEEIFFSIIMPDNVTHNGSYNFGAITTDNAGTYTFMTTEGCRRTLQISVTDPNIPDDDNDGVPNTQDNCPNTPNGATVNANGCAASELDDDSDGVLNSNDNCPNTPNGENVDSNGCAASQLDDDNDGVINNNDNCPNTPNGATVDANGCAASQLDDDNDGVMNNNDNCPNTPNGATVDANGCAASQLDDDNDGVPNDQDLCPNTVIGATVDNQGCSNAQQDIDNDGVPNSADQCNNTPAGATVNADGCAASEMDDDDDGVPNTQDLCPNTPANANVDQDGCVIDNIPVDNFRISAISLTCNSNTDGQIAITATAPLSYSATLTAENYSANQDFTSNIIFDGLSQNTYELCIRVSEFPDFESCSQITVNGPDPLSVYTDLNSQASMLSLQMTGAKTYFVTFNDHSFKTSKNNLELQLKEGNNTVMVKTDKDCQGIYEDSFYTSKNGMIFPNPFKDFFKLSLVNQKPGDIVIRIFNSHGQLVKSKHFTKSHQTDMVVETPELSPGLYMINLIQENAVETFKLVKQ